LIGRHHSGRGENGFIISMSRNSSALTAAGLGPDYELLVGFLIMFNKRAGGRLALPPPGLWGAGGGGGC
jgi:hypothetical protein